MGETSEKTMRIKDIYVGKPDAKDEVNFEGVERFIKSFVVADHFNLDHLLYGNNCFITGFKGTGKTALLFYLEDKIKSEDNAACTSYIFFKEEFTDARRDELNNLSQRVLSAISVERDSLIDTTEFEYIWRWIFLKQIVNDNESYSRNLFVQDENWKNFEEIVAHIVEPENKRKFRIPNKIRIAIPVKDPVTMTEMTPNIEVDLRDMESSNYGQFVRLVDEAEMALARVRKTDIPYYIFVDELEAYYGEDKLFRRDLCMIRDLVFTVKRFNSNFARLGMKEAKIICSIRSEIINAIERFVVSKEINKVISGFSVPLTWNYANTNSYAHPIIKIILKRIMLCQDEVTEKDLLTIYRKWFPENIHGIEPASYILNNSWYKPRDMIRFLICAQNCMYNENEAFTENVVDSLTREYSEESLNEIREELRALYTSEEIEDIVSCFTGYKTIFSIHELEERISRFYSESILATDLNQVLRDLYRLGFLGNFLPESKIYHWHHRGDSAMIVSDEWRLCIHYALYRALSVGGRTNYQLSKGKCPQIGDVALAECVSIKRSFVLLKLYKNGKRYSGQIHISEFGKKYSSYIKDLHDYIGIGDTIRVVLGEYNEEREVWQLRIADDKEGQ